MASNDFSARVSENTRRPGSMSQPTRAITRRAVSLRRTSR
jgi:hypothetical protein